MRKKILLTGGNGFIGKNIQTSFLTEKYEITAPRSFELDLTDTEQVDNFFRTHSFDVVLHAAAKPGHRNAKDPTNLFYTNIRMFENLVRHTDKFGKLINLGSGAIYDIAADNRLVTENQIGLHCGKDDHSFCKYVVHKRIENLQNAVDLNIFGIFGPHEDWEIRFISNAICKTLFDLPITLRQNRRFSYLYIDDLMPILDFFITHNTKYTTYNITPDTETELLTAAKTVQKIGGKNNPIHIAKEGYGLNYSGSNARLKEEMLNVTFTPLEIAVKKLFDYYKTRQEKLEKKLLLTDK
ncbi:MAG: NAD-dependent epimerase/dehydratase family protein [Elusimicrobiaceae bacterium]|nr:NAD-dependent epimerase/dehydratase family protein [Elusimicrobiaceae bacterium]